MAPRAGTPRWAGDGYLSRAGPGITRLGAIALFSGIGSVSTLHLRRTTCVSALSLGFPSFHRFLPVTELRSEEPVTGLAQLLTGEGPVLCSHTPGFAHRAVEKHWNAPQISFNFISHSGPSAVRPI